MFIKWLSSFIILLLLVSCGEKLDVKPVFQKRYSINDCIARVNIRADHLGYDKADVLRHEITPTNILSSYRDNSYPLFNVVTSNEWFIYYFFFADKCEEKIRYVDSIMVKYMIDKTKYPSVTYGVVSIQEDDLPVSLSRPIGLWVDY